MKLVAETSVPLLDAQSKTIAFALRAGCLLEKAQREKVHFNKKKVVLKKIDSNKKKTFRGSTDKNNLYNSLYLDPHINARISICRVSFSAGGGGGGEAVRSEPLRSQLNHRA